MTNSPTNRGAVVITGASRGIGRTLALDLSAKALMYLRACVGRRTAKPLRSGAMGTSPPYTSR